MLQIDTYFKSNHTNPAAVKPKTPVKKVTAKPSVKVKTQPQKKQIKALPAAKKPIALATESVKNPVAKQGIKKATIKPKSASVKPVSNPILKPKTDVKSSAKTTST